MGYNIRNRRTMSQNTTHDEQADEQQGSDLTAEDIRGMSVPEFEELATEKNPQRFNHLWHLGDRQQTNARIYYDRETRNIIYNRTAWGDIKVYEDTEEFYWDLCFDFEAPVVVCNEDEPTRAYVPVKSHPQLFTLTNDGLEVKKDWGEDSEEMREKLNNDNSILLEGQPSRGTRTETVNAREWFEEVRS